MKETYRRQIHTNALDLKTIIGLVHAYCYNPCISCVRLLAKYHRQSLVKYIYNAFKLKRLRTLSKDETIEQYCTTACKDISFSEYKATCVYKQHICKLSGIQIRLQFQHRLCRELGLSYGFTHIYAKRTCYHMYMQFTNTLSTFNYWSICVPIT